MQIIQWPGNATCLAQDDGRRAVREDLRRAARGEAPLGASFQTFALCQEEQARAGADLLERETWALTMILSASGPIWKQLASPTLRFTLDHRGEPIPYHLELGHFPDLAALAAPSTGEQALREATTPCWARVTPHIERQRAGQTGAFDCSYEPISIGEAVGRLGLAKILAQIDAAACTAGQAILAEAEVQDERQARLLRVERMLGWEPDPATAPTATTRSTGDRLMLALLGQDGRARLALDALYLGLVVVLLFFLIGVPYTLIAFVALGPGLLIGRHANAA